MIKNAGDQFKLLIVIVKKELSRTVIRACKEGGSDGGTVLLGRGTGKFESGSIFGFKVETEKAVILSVIPDHLVDSVIASVEKSANLHKPGTGIAFVVNSKTICGVAHLLKNDF
ncbi:MAG: P-II family nitrogen regulator [Balneolaceae bacterium]|nr:MAG: P-II family nitrogen regulator [Balneolaceae bacterium]